MKFYRFRRNDLAYRSLGQIKTHHDNRQRNDQAGNILHPAMAKRMLIVIPFARDFKAYERYNRRTCIRKIVKRIRGNGNGGGEYARNILCNEQKNV